MTGMIHRVAGSARLAALFTLPLCLLVLVWAASAAAGPTRTIKTPPKKIGDTTYTSETVEENFGTKDKPAWKRIETRETSETPRQPPNSTTVDREIKIRKYDKGSKRATETTTITEVKQPVFKLEPTIKSRTTRTVTYGNVGGKRKKVKEVVESWEVVEVTKFGEVFAEGTRVTKTYGPKGTKTTNEVLNRKTGQWELAKTPSGKKSASSQAPLGAQQQGLPTNNPALRGVVVPDAPHQPGYGSKSRQMPRPSY